MSFLSPGIAKEKINQKDLPAPDSSETIISIVTKYID
jgi:hypothetical protein